MKQMNVFTKLKRQSETSGANNHAIVDILYNNKYNTKANAERIPMLACHSPEGALYPYCYRYNDQF